MTCAFLFPFLLFSLSSISSSYVPLTPSHPHVNCQGAYHGGPWAACRFEGAILDPSKEKCGFEICIPYDNVNMRNPAWGVWKQPSDDRGGWKGWLGTREERDSSHLSCRQRQLKSDAFLIHMEYTHNTFFHFVAQVLVKLYGTTSHLYTNTSLHIYLSGVFSKSHIEWLQLFSDYPVRSLDSLRKEDLGCFHSVATMDIEDWFMGAFHLLHLEWKPELSLSGFADFMHLRSGTTRRTLVPDTSSKVKVVYIWRDQDRSAPDRYNRKVANQEELIEAMRRVIRADVQVIKLETLSPVQQLKVIEDAAIMIGPHGAGLVNLLYLPRCSVIIEIFPGGAELKQHPANTFINLAHFSGHHYIPYISSRVVDPGFETVDIRKMTTDVPIEEFLRLFRKTVDSFPHRCESGVSMFGPQTVKMERGSMKFAEQIDDAKKK